MDTAIRKDAAIDLRELDNDGDLLICITCGTQHSAVSTDALDNTCRICEDPRQWVPSSGQAWTSLSRLRASGTYSNSFHETSPCLTSIFTTPKLGIGQRALLVRLPPSSFSGSPAHQLGQAQDQLILWDCISYLDEATIEGIRKYGTLTMICISHPHYYASSVTLAKVFGGIPIYMFSEDEEWICRPALQWEPIRGDRLALQGHGITQTNNQGRNAGGEGTGKGDWEMIKIGGHFPGSAVLYSKSRQTILVGDTISMTPGNRRMTYLLHPPWQQLLTC